MKYLRLLVILCLFYWLSVYDCYAFDKNYKYNYEITSVNFNGQVGSIEGWGILNAGVTDSSNRRGCQHEHCSPNLDPDLESTKTNSYQYELRIYALNINGSNIKEVKYINATKSVVSSQKSLTQVMCYKSSGKCVDNRSSEYENVKFRFSFDFNDFNNPSKYKNAAYPSLLVNGYRLELTIRSTAGNCNGSNNSKCSETFGLSFLESAVSNEAKKYFDSSSYMSQVYLVANEISAKTGSCSTGNTAFQVEQAGNSYGIITNQYCSSVDMTYYKVKNGTKEGWIPASWIAPLKSSYTVMQNDVCNVSENDFRFNGVKNNAASNSCNGDIKLEDKASGSCKTQDGSQYYKFTCKDVMDVEFVPSQEKYYQSDQFNISVKVTSYVSCEGVFDYLMWNSKYNSGNANTKHSLETIRDNFLNFSMSNYASNLNGTFNYKDNNNVIQRIPLKVNSVNNISLSTKNIVYASNQTRLPKTMTYQTNKQVVTMSLSSLVNIVNINTDEAYEVIVKNLGYDAKSEANYSCIIKLMEPVYRSIDLKNPFIDPSRITGENWLNSTFDFRGIIDEDVWDHAPKYVFAISRKDVLNIRKNTDSIGASAYIGSQCQVRNNKHYCPFLRDSKYFSQIYIKE